MHLILATARTLKKVRLIGLDFFFGITHGTFPHLLVKSLSFCLRLCLLRDAQRVGGMLTAFRAERSSHVPMFLWLVLPYFMQSGLRDTS